MQKKFKCRTFPKEDAMYLDYGKEHILISIKSKTKFREDKELSICLNDQDIDKLIKYLHSVRGES